MTSRSPDLNPRVVVDEHAHNANWITDQDFKRRRHPAVVLRLVRLVRAHRDQNARTPTITRGIGSSLSRRREPANFVPVSGNQMAPSGPAVIP